MTWTIEKRKRSTLIFVTDRESTDILIGSGSNKKEYKRSMELAKVIVAALNDYKEKNEEDFANSLRENDSGHQPC